MLHKDATGAEAVHQSAYVQDTDPGSVGALKAWIDTSGSIKLHKVRNITNDGWITVGAAGSATESGPGVIEIATQAEADAGADDTRAITSLKLENLDKWATKADLSSGKVPTSQLPDTVLGGLDYQGTWNASTNSPNLGGLTPSKGDYYKVTTAGSTSLSGITDWAVGDWAVYDGAAWDKVDNSESGASVPSATETTEGKAELATQSEVDTGTDDTRIVTPLKAATRFLAKVGGTLTGALTLPGDPTNDLHAATKAYVDAALGGSSGHRNLVTLGSDVANSTTTLADVTGLSFPVVANTVYRIDALIAFDSAASATGSKWTVNGPSIAGGFAALVVEWTSAASTWSTNNVNAMDAAPFFSATSMSTTGNLCRIMGVLKPTANGTVVIRFASEVAASAITAKAGSTLEWF